jgi:beta-glucosidase
MKRLTLYLLVIVMSLMLVGCKTEKDPVVDPDPVVVDCELVPNHSECKEEVKPTICTEEDELCIVEVEELLTNMTLLEKVGQMVQAERGSISPSEVTQYAVGSILSGGGSHPSSYDNTVDDWYDMYENYQDAALLSSSGIPIIYGIDAVHGNNNVYGATIFPHNIGLGAANDPDLMYRIGEATAAEIKVTGITWTFAPALSVVQDIRWGRTYEGFSENPLIHSNLTYQTIMGLQSFGVSATAKHFVADGGTAGGTDQGTVYQDEQTVRDIHLVPYYDAIEAGVDTIMISYSSIYGNKMHGSEYWITDILKEEMGFDGFIISDWNAIHQLPGDFKTQVVSSVNAGVDMLMEPYDWKNTISALEEAVNEELITMNRINDAVRRILTVKYNRGLLDDPYERLNEDDYFYTVEHQDLAREAVRKSLVLLKNENDVLPLNSSENIYLVGPGADSVGFMSGGWTTYWQGNNSSDIGVGTSIYDAFRKELSLNGASLVSDMNNADIVVVVLTETPYAESGGDNGVLDLVGGNAHPDNADALATAEYAHSQGKTVIGILISGRPLILGDYIDYFDSFIAAWLPGSEGGNGISDVVFGDYDFTGKLSFTWPIDSSQFGYNSNDENYDESSVMYPYGYGLTYND